MGKLHRNYQRHELLSIDNVDCPLLTVLSLTRRLSSTEGGRNSGDGKDARRELSYTGAPQTALYMYGGQGLTLNCYLENRLENLEETKAKLHSID